jgi:uncharacterized damage-inducible protein DinB
MTLQTRKPAACACGCSAHHAADHDSPALPLVALLGQLGDLLATLDDTQYVKSPVGAMTSSIGAHVRHSLDHVEAIRHARRTGVVDYDTRVRGTAVEGDRSAALRAIHDHAEALSKWQPDDLLLDVAMSVLLSADGPPLMVRTTLGRELAFAVNHTIHHNAMLAAMVATLGGQAPERFGYAPSTVRYLREQSA